MRAIVLTEPGGPEALTLATLPDPRPGVGEVVVEVHATALNYSDLLQRQGRYSVATGLPAVLGVECSGTVLELGPGVQGWSVGDRVCALVAGGAYAERVCVPATQLLPVPVEMDLVHAAALPEAACTVWSNVFDIGGLQSGQSLLVHGGASGIGTFAIQCARAADAKVFATAGSAEKLARCIALGADVAISYREQDFVAEVKRHTEGRGADLVLDNMGAAYLSRNVDVLAHDGRIVMIGLQGGRDAEVPLGRMMAKRATLFTTSLRDRSAAAKARIVEGVRRDFWPLLAAGRVKPVIDTIMSSAQMGDAHRYMESGRHVGKIVVTLGN